MKNTIFELCSIPDDNNMPLAIVFTFKGVYLKLH